MWESVSELPWQFSPSDITTFSWRDSVWELAPETLTQMCWRQVLSLRGVILFVIISHDSLNLYQWHINKSQKDLWKYLEIRICDLKCIRTFLSHVKVEVELCVYIQSHQNPVQEDLSLCHLQDQYNSLHDQFCWSDQYRSRWHTKLTYKQFSS